MARAKEVGAIVSMCSTSSCRGRSERSTGSRAAPACRHGVGPEGVRDSGDRDHLANGSRSDEQPLVCARPGELEQQAVRRPEDAFELAGPDEDTARGGAVGPDLRGEPDETAPTPLLP